MALLITLAVIGGLSALAALYVLGTYIFASIVAHTQLVKEKINAVINDYRTKRLAKKQAKADAQNTETEAK